ncbi:glutathione peroxidase [Auriculariales sp. MPI-PUGE-AT-0066]|nr:glutathione peroxidase [Auriculariales sp. MPI-PUGE-AT-0066]
MAIHYYHVNATSRISTAACFRLRISYSDSLLRMATSFHDFTVALPKSQTLNVADLKDKVVLVVNVASRCGLTPQYEGLQQLYSKYHDRGLEILGFPCNQFGAQEPGTEEEIATFCDVNYKISFPLTRKIEVNGDGAHPIYQWLKKQKPGVEGQEDIKWNFEKFLIAKDGTVSARYSPVVAPDALEVEIERLLA